MSSRLPPIANQNACYAPGQPIIQIVLTKFHYCKFRSRDLRSGSGGGDRQGAMTPLALFRTTFFAPLAPNKIKFSLFVMPHFAQHIMSLIFCYFFIVQVKKISSLASFSISFLNSCKLKIEVPYLLVLISHILGVLGVHLSVSCS